MKKTSKAQARQNKSREQIQANKRIKAVTADMRNGDTVMTLGEQLAMLTDKYEQALSKYGSNHPATQGYLSFVRSYSKTITDKATDKAKAEAEAKANTIAQ
jgi:preprotein translocase subunit YajC